MTCTRLVWVWVWARSRNRRELERLSEDRNIFSRTPINGHIHNKFAKKHIKLEVTASPWNFEKGVCLHAELHCENTM